MPRFLQGVELYGDHRSGAGVVASSIEQIVVPSYTSGARREIKEVQKLEQILPKDREPVL